MSDIAKIKLWIPDRAALQKVLAAGKLSIECGAPKRDGDQFVVTLYGPKAEAQQVVALGYKHDLDEHYGDYLAARQKEVSTTDRFRGGAVKPVGLGVKRKG
jgi:hypothetical protein